MSRNVAILGSTGSIGTNALRVIEALGPEYRVAALSAHNSIDLLAEQARAFSPDVVAVSNPERLGPLKERLGGYRGEVLGGPESLVAAASQAEVDIVLTAIVGVAGLPAVLEAARRGKTLAIANKEPLVVAGELLTETAREAGATILPVDSEHSAIFQCLQAGRAGDVRRIILTASGGPFRGRRPEEVADVTIEEALSHPTWTMGPKITIDSATMMNKALEVIEARWLFDMEPGRIDIVIHPESVIHSMVEFVDGSMIAQLGTPDMTVPIQYALTYPERRKGLAEGLRLEDMGRLTFETPDRRLFRSLELVYDVAQTGGTAPAVFNAANEVAVEEFLAGRIKFPRIVELIEACLGSHSGGSSAHLEDLLAADAWARRQVREYLS